MIATFTRKMIRRQVGANSRLNRLAVSLPYERLSELRDVRVGTLDLSSEAHLSWLATFLPDHKFNSPYFKKPIEFSATYQILNPGPDDVFLDAAGGVYTYLHRILVRAKYMQDLQLPLELRQRLGNEIEYVESNAAAIPLPDASIDKISCHHSFEHFERDADTEFVREVQRLLRPGGRACILPLFVSERFFEITSRLSFAKKFDPASHRLLDPSATLPGGNGYARVYDQAALERRVLTGIDRRHFSVSMLEIRMDGRPVPDLDLPCNRNVAAINKPFRALVIDRLR